MQDWLKISLALCLFGFFREMRPSEPFVVEFLSGPWRNITSDQVNREIYPLGTYSYLVQLVIIFLVTDILRYKPIIVLSACCGIVLWSLLLWTKSMLGIQMTQLMYGTFMAAEVAYYTYMYAKVEKSKYEQVTGHARGAILSGKFLAGVIAQLLISFNLMDVRELNYISFAAQIVSLPISILLPTVGTSLYFYAPKTILPTGSQSISTIQNIGNIEDQPKQHETTTKNNSMNSLTVADINQNSLTSSSNESFGSDIKSKPKFSCNRAVSLLGSHFIAAYSNKIVLQWSFWWALAMCGFSLVQSYVQLLWQQIDPKQENFFNGAVEAMLTLLGACGAIAAGFLNSKRFEKWDLFILTGCSVLEGGLILICAMTNSVFVAYTTYILFGILYQFMITVASATVAKNLIEDSFALIFGINTLVALILQTIMTVVVISESGFSLDPRGQFIVFGGYFIGLALIYATAGVISKVLHKNKTEFEIKRDSSDNRMRGGEEERAK